MSGRVQLVVVLLTSLSALAAQESRPAARPLLAEDVDGLPWRSIGPANMGGRVAAIALVPGSRTTFYAGFATGGVWKTENLGVTFSPVFDKQPTLCIGSIACAPEQGKQKVVWVGTGEGNGRNSSSWGRGVFRSEDGGATWISCGLENTHDIPRLALDPRDPAVCYVAALGHLFGPNPERGVFRTADGGKTWQHVLRIDENTGACDVVVDPVQPDTVYAALYARRRTPWSFEGNSTQGGIFKSTDAGKSWKKLGNGLPTRTGRIGLAVHAGDPRILYAVVESDLGGSGKDPIDDNRSPHGGVFRSDDRGESWVRTSDLAFRPFYFGRIATDPKDDKRVYLPGWDLAISDDGGKHFRPSGSEKVHVDFHAIVVDPGDPDRILVGNDGGLYVSHDRAKTWEHLNRMAVGQFYKVGFDLGTPYRVGGGLQDNGSWIGPSQTAWQSEGEKKDGITSADWEPVLFGDGFGVAFDPEDRNVVYATSQGGELTRIRLDDGRRRSLRPVPREGQAAFRFNWDAPFLISKHDPSVLYLGGSRVFRLTERGDQWTAISGDLSAAEVRKVTTVGSGAETYGTVVALSEGAKGTLLAGTDDGHVHWTRDDGVQWTEVTPPEARGLYVAGVELSRFDADTAYVAIDGHRSDVFRPLLFATSDGGRTWRDLSGDLPKDVPVRVVREDPTNPNVLFCGTETGVQVSLDRGGHWTRIHGKALPPVRIDDLQIHPRDHDLLLATHGRSLWVLDDASCFAERGTAPLTFCPVRPAQPRLYRSRDYGAGHARFTAQNPPLGAFLDFWLAEDTRDPAKVAIEDASGFVLRELEAPARRGWNRIVWDLQADKKHVVSDPDDQRHDQTRFVAPGAYKAKLSVGTLAAEQPVTVLPLSR